MAFGSARDQHKRTPLHTVVEPPMGFLDPDTVQTAYDEADLNRAVQAYRFFYPTVSMAACFRGMLSAHAIVNRTIGILRGNPLQLIFTANSDTPYASILLDLKGGPITIELPPGPLIGVGNDLNQRWVSDMGLPGPDEGKGGKHVLIPPAYKGEIPEGFHQWHSTTNRVLLAIRSLPLDGNVDQAIELMKTVKFAPLLRNPHWVQGAEPEWVDISEIPQDGTPVSYETNLGFWEALHEVVHTEPPYEGYRNEYGELAVLGIIKGKPFAPDERMKEILEQAAKIANVQMRAQAFADRRPDRIVWQDRHWEWVTLTPESGFFDRPNYVDLDAREKWFFQAIIESPAMFRRKVGFGSVYWLAARDRNGDYLDGSETYKLVIPQPVPAKLFWSVTVYDPETRSQIQTGQKKAALRSLFELREKSGAELYFGPKAPAGHEGEWIQTIPGKGWFTYFRVYGPEEAAFNGAWRPGDFELLK